MSNQLHKQEPRTLKKRIVIIENSDSKNYHERPILGENLQQLNCSESPVQSSALKQFLIENRKSDNLDYINDLIKERAQIDPLSKSYLNELTQLHSNNKRKLSELKQLLLGLATRANDLEQKLQNIEDKVDEDAKETQKKKNRRTSAEIEKEFICPYENCQKQYGSDVSLNLHIKIKHNGGNKTERERIAVDLFRQILIARLNGQGIPDVNINLPPNYLEQFKELEKKN